MTCPQGRRAPRLLAVALVLVALLGTTGCSSMGLALAEDLTRVAGAVTNQEATANRLADQIAAARAAQQEAERRAAEQAHELERRQQQVGEHLGKIAADLDQVEQEAGDDLPPGTESLLATIAAGLAVYLNDRRRTRIHDEREEGLRAEVAARPRTRRATTSSTRRR